MTSFFERAIRWLIGSPEPLHEQSTGIMNMLKKLLNALERTQEVEYDCGEVYKLLDQYAEMVNRGEDASQLMPLVKQHLDLCRDCQEEFDALMHVLEYHSAETA